jgi:diguanylate cyclase (GGDEF)-like protein
MPKGETRHGGGAKAGAKLRVGLRPKAHDKLRDKSRATSVRPQGKHRGVPPRRSAAMQLAAEVERLERELATARTRMAELEVRAEIDPLTDILNRRGFERALKRSLDHAKRYESNAALVYLDLDGFKAINDRHGHAAGDAVLKAVAMVLMRHVRASDVVARLGGDEFAVLLWQLTEADVERKARSLEAAVARTTATHAGAALSVAASAGAALLLPLDKPADVLERADRAMYARKRARSCTRASADQETSHHRRSAH